MKIWEWIILFLISVVSFISYVILMIVTWDDQIRVFGAWLKTF